MSPVGSLRNQALTDLLYLTQVTQTTQFVADDKGFERWKGEVCDQGSLTRIFTGSALSGRIVTQPIYEVAAPPLSFVYRSIV
ncbi:MAG: hypothetical protein ACI88C_003137 [Acidimicrobiales bacterium]|jgi:hypothetical protein